jgi:phosphoserine phosphatase RsbU/P
MDILKQHEDFDNLILVVDDEPTARMLIRRTLEKGGYRVLEAAGGRAALDLAAAALPSVALVDAMMPDMDGFELCERLKSHKQTGDVQVLMVTALSDIADIERGFKAGALDYIRKPFNPHELLIRTRNACYLRNSQRAQKRWREQMTRDLYIAERLQQRLLANPPIMNSCYALNSAYHPSGGISGDVFDRFELPDGSMLFYVADVCGHGVAASLVSSLLKAVAGETVRALATAPLYEICSVIDAKFRELIYGDGMYATAFFGVYDPPHRRLAGLSCGHPSPIIIRGGGAVEMPFAERGGVPIGFAFGATAGYASEDQIEVELAAGDSLFAYTDGLFEAESVVNGAECGFAGLKRLAGAVADDSPFSYRSAALLIERLEEGGFDIEQDDCSVLVLQTLSARHGFAELSPACGYRDVADTGLRLEGMLIARGWEADDAWRVRLLLIEYCNNIIEHGTQPEEHQLELMVWFLDSDCIVRVADESRPVDFQGLIEGAVMPETPVSGGRGLPIIREIAADVECLREDGRNISYFTVRKESCRKGGA